MGNPSLIANSRATPSRSRCQQANPSDREFVSKLNSDCVGFSITHSCPVRYGCTHLPASRRTCQTTSPAAKPEGTDDAPPNPKSEARDPKEARNPNAETDASSSAIRISAFGFLSEFELRNSDLYSPAHLLTVARNTHFPAGKSPPASLVLEPRTMVFSTCDASELSYWATIF